MKIEFGIYIIIFFLPVYLLRLNIFGIPSTALELMIYILFIIWFIKNHYRIKLTEIISDKTLRFGIILLFAGAAISTFFSTDLRTSAGILKGWFFDPFLFFIILVSEIKTLKQKENILKAFFFSGLAVAFLSLFYVFFSELNGITYDARLRAFYLSPNYLAMYLSPALIIGVWLFFLSLRGAQQSNAAISSVAITKRDCFICLMTGLAKTKKYIYLTLIIIIAAALYFTFSYSAWLAIFFAIIFLFCFIVGTEKKPSFQWKLGFLSILLIFIFLFFSQINNDKFSVLKNSVYRSSFHSRLMIWQSAWEIGKDNWLLGIGPGNFQKYYLDYQAKFSEPYLEWAVPEPHNIFLAFWLEAGLMGLLGFLAILAWFFKRCLTLLKTNLLHKEKFLLVIVLFSLMIYMITHGLVDTTYWKNDLAIIFWLELALLVSIEK